MLYFEDFVPGSVATHAGPTVTREGMLAFAREYDAQPMHVDEEAAKHSFVGTLIASGWYTCALLMQMIADDFILDSASMGSPGIDELRWLAPVKPGDTLSMRRTIVEARASKSRADRGFVAFRFEVLNQRGETVMTQANKIMFGRRVGSGTIADADSGSGKAVPPAMPAPGTDAPVAPTPAAPPASALATPYFDDLVIGSSSELGSFTFTADEIKRFARHYDPQPFHVDEEAARASHFGRLMASGWQTAAIWMKLMVAARRLRLTAAEGRTGAGVGVGVERPARLGPSPGFRELKWLKPVYAGDTLAYRSEIVDKRPSASRPGWGLVFNRNIADNQRGERAFEFTGAVFWERRDGAHKR